MIIGGCVICGGAALVFVMYTAVNDRKQANVYGFSFSLSNELIRIIVVC